MEREEFSGYTGLAALAFVLFHSLYLSAILRLG